MSNRGDETGGRSLRRARYRSAERPEGSGQRGSEQGGVDAWAAYLEQRRVVPGSDDPETASVFQSPAFQSNFKSAATRLKAPKRHRFTAP